MPNGTELERDLQAEVRRALRAYLRVPTRDHEAAVERAVAELRRLREVAVLARGGWGSPAGTGREARPPAA